MGPPLQRCLPLLLVALSGCRFDPSGLARASGDSAPSVLPDLTSDLLAATEASPDGPRGWWNGAWTRRRKLTFSNSWSDDLTSFPVLVVLDGTRIDFSATAAGGADLRFVDADQQTVLAHEIERWEPAARCHVWVRVPLIPKSSTTDRIWMYYGGGAAPDGQSRDAVWSGGFAGVWHLGDGVDSSPNHSDATVVGTKPTPGRIAGGRRFEGGSDHLELPNVPGLKLDQQTVELWLKTSQTWDGEYYPGDATLIGRPSGGCNSHDWVIIGGKVGAANGCVVVGVGAAKSPACDKTLYSLKDRNKDQWHYVVWTRTAAGWNQLRIDADEEGNLQDDGSSISADRPIHIGGDTLNAGARFLVGTLDEVRISHGVRSAAWINAQYASMRDAGFVTYGAEENAP